MENRARINESAVEWDIDGPEKQVFESHYREMSRQLTAEARVQPRYGDTPPFRPFEVDLVRIPAGKKMCPRHSHSAQWEYYIVLSGSGEMLQDGDDPSIPMQPGDHLMQPAGWVHTVLNSGTEELIYYVIANNPVDEVCYYPDSNKWAAAGHVFRMVEADYFDGEG